METSPQRSAGASVTGGAYALLLLLGVMEGLIGCFQYSGMAGPVPVAALLLAVALFGSCVLAGIGMGSAAGAFAVAAGWFAASFVLALPTSGGSVIVTNTRAGTWYLYGGALAAMAAIMVMIAARARLAGRR